MRVEDKIYGEVEIEEPILLELLNSSSVLRLKKISQFGIPDKYYHHKNFSRYEHSVGAMLLLRKLGATLEEQVAGLLHDVSVLTFSHIADWVFSRGSEGVEDYHEKIHKEFVRKTKVPEILEKYNFSIEKILNQENFDLLEKEIPDLCADRVDYSLRELKYWLNPEIVETSVKNLENFNGEIAFADREAAFDFATNFLELNTRHWGGYESMIRYHLFSKALKMALAQGIIVKEDFYKDEDIILEKIEDMKHTPILEILNTLRRKDLTDLKRNSGQKVVKKFRYVDPKIIMGGRLTRLSEIDSQFREIIIKHREINKRGLIV